MNVDFSVLPKSGIVVISNYHTKEFLLIGSMDLAGALFRTFKAIKNKENVGYRNMFIPLEARRLAFTYLDCDISTERLGIRYWCRFNDYIEMGWTPYLVNNSMPKYVFRLDYGQVDNGVMRVFATLRTKRGKEIVVGVFATLEEAEKFQNRAYKNGVVRDLFFDTGELTNEYRNR